MTLGGYAKSQADRGRWNNFRKRQKLYIFSTKYLDFRRNIFFFNEKSRFSIVYRRNEEIRRRDRHRAKLWKKSLRKWLTISKWAFGEPIFRGGSGFFSCFWKITMVVLSWDESGKIWEIKGNQRKSMEKWNYPEARGNRPVSPLMGKHLAQSRPHIYPLAFFFPEPVHLFPPG